MTNTATLFKGLKKLIAEGHDLYVFWGGIWGGIMKGKLD